MAVKFVVLLGVVLAFLLVSQDLACARELTETNGLHLLPSQHMYDSTL